MLRRTKSITLTILAAIAASACDESTNNSEIKHCVDENGVVHDESQCANIPADAGTHDPQHPHSSSPHFFWYYGGGSSPISPGGRVTGGSYSPSPGRSYSPPSTITRGGFGGTGRSTGAGGGGGGGGGE